MALESSWTVHAEQAAAAYRGWLVTLALLASPFVCTWIYTSVKFRIDLARGQKPPTVPYTIPFVGHTLSFALDTARYLQQLR